MPFQIVLVDKAVDDLRRMPAFHRSAVRDAIEQHLRHHPILLSKSRIKRLEDIESPQYRLRVGDFRIFYDIQGGVVVVLAILSKEESVQWLKEREKNHE